MLFNSYLFIFAFLPLAFLGFHVLGSCLGRRAAIAWLCCASLFFYGWWNPPYIFLILFSIAFNYGIGRFLLALTGMTTKKRVVFFLGIATNLGLLGYFKYANFFVENLQLLLDISFKWETVILPIAISFFTFQQIAYLADTYSGVTKEHSLLSYILFVTFFPQLIAGPIVHHSQMMPQFESKKGFNFAMSDLAIGLSIFFIGLFKKVVIADTLALFASPVFNAADAGAAVTFVDAWGAALSYTFQLYFDFSGYSDMAIGLGRIFGIKLPLNFNSPYKAVSISDFWKRWHITLSNWLRDYLFMPLSSTKFMARLGLHRNLLLSMMITMLLGGLWHGAGWNFVLWGGLHGLYLVVNHCWRLLLNNYGIKPSKKRSYIVFSVLLTFFVVMIAWVPFRATTFQGSSEILNSMFSVSELRKTNWHEVFSTTVISKQDQTTIVDWGLLQKFAYSADQKYYVDIFNWEHFNPQFSILEIFNLDLGGLYCLLFCFFIVWTLPNTQEFLYNYEPYFGAKKDKQKFSFSLFPLSWRPNLFWAIVTGLAASSCFLLLGVKLSEFLYFQF